MRFVRRYQESVGRTGGNISAHNTTLTWISGAVKVVDSRTVTPMDSGKNTDGQNDTIQHPVPNH